VSYPLNRTSIGATSDGSPTERTRSCLPMSGQGGCHASWLAVVGNGPTAPGARAHQSTHLGCTVAGVGAEVPYGADARSDGRSPKREWTTREHVRRQRHGSRPRGPRVQPTRPTEAIGFVREASALTVRAPQVLCGVGAGASLSVDGIACATPLTAPWSLTAPCPTFLGCKARVLRRRRRGGGQRRPRGERWRRADRYRHLANAIEVRNLTASHPRGVPVEAYHVAVRRRENADPNETILKRIFEEAQRLHVGGLDQEQAIVTASKASLDALEKTSPDYAESLIRQGHRFVSRQRRYERGFRRRLRKHWGEPLGLLLAFIATAEEAGRICDARNRDGAIEQNDVLFDVLYQMNGQACRIAREVHALLEAGYPFGALARCRTLHEVSVRTQVLKACGREPNHLDLAEKYVLHDHVVNYRDARVYQRHAAALGYEPFDDAFMSEMKAVHDELVGRYGAPYQSPYGWASGLPGVSVRPNFGELERLAKVDHLRGHYSWASHEIHADAKAMRLNMLERGGQKVVLTGATNVGLADPGSLASVYLHQTTVSFLLCVDVPAHFDLYSLQAMTHMRDKIDDALADAEASVHEAEERLRSRLAKRGKRMDPIHGVVKL
jgi:hypothetical protein